ncbi:hypothetical protein AB0M12_08870 [Nocardia vinacea]|uniref:hypothetical protein n=1 Tax=Nocardia vinacea TaxID=96468 RepID=UPI003438E7D9
MHQRPFSWIRPRRTGFEWHWCRRLLDAWLGIRGASAVVRAGQERFDREYAVTVG